MSTLTYLASPYTHPDKTVRIQRFTAVCLIAGVLMKHLRMHIYSPIAHSHPIADLVDLPTDFAYWQALDETMLDRCDGGIIILQLGGWTESVGVLGEAKKTHADGRPVQFFSWSQYRKFADAYGCVNVTVDRLRECFAVGERAATMWRATHSIGETNAELAYGKG